MTSETPEWERITEGLGTEEHPYWQNTFNDYAVSDDGGKTYYLLNEPLGPDGAPRIYSVEERPVPDKHYPVDLEQAVAMAVGTGSVCWDEDRVFDDVLAKKACDDLVKWVNANYDKKENPRA